nr:hypothetical protein [Tanacetum cinerariifolium]
MDDGEVDDGVTGGRGNWNGDRFLDKLSSFAKTLTQSDANNGEIWKFRHSLRGTPITHLLTTGWSSYVNQKKLVSGDSIVFVRTVMIMTILDGGLFGKHLLKELKEPPHLGPERPRVYSDLSPEEKDRYTAHIRATNILLQGLPKDIYTFINHYTDAKDIWDNVKMLLDS